MSKVTERDWDAMLYRRSHNSKSGGTADMKVRELMFVLNICICICASDSG
ncbi:MAG: hypothetical protein PUG00_05475 [Clostridiales bacterium]|nr:hypothetical protein [Clostridiales bacterium]